MYMIYLSSLAIVVGPLLAFFFPYEALQLSTYSLPLLGLITFLVYLDYDFKFEKLVNPEIKKSFFFYLGIIFFLVPALQWYLAYFLLDDKALRFGLFLSSICPPALLLPLFFKSNEALKLKAHQFVFVFTVIFTLILFLLLKLYHFEEFQISLKNIFVDILNVTVLPIFILFILKKVFKMNFQFVNLKIRHFLSLLSIAILTYCFFGVAFAKSNFATITPVEYVVIFSLVVFQDFGVFYLTRLLLQFFNRENDLLLSALASTRNVAIAGYILMFYIPKAALIPAMVMFVHAFYFIFINFKAQQARV